MTVAAPPKPKKKPTPPTLDPSTQYARDVVDGRIVAGRAVRLACERHLRDLTQQRTAAFPYYWDEAAARHIIDFFPAFLTLENGEPFVLPPWLQFSYGLIFGWKVWGGDKATTVDPQEAQRAGKRRFIYGFLETSKGSGKTPSAAGLGLYGLTFDDEPYAEVYSAAYDKEQASIILNDAVRMANASPDLVHDERLDVGKYNIASRKNGSFFRAVSKEHRGKSGPRPHMVLGDEIHEHLDGRVITKMIAGFKFRPQPLALLLTNSGSDKTSICWEYHQKSMAVLERTLVDEQWFAYVCQLDPCDRCHAEGFRQPKDGCPDCDNWLDEAVWPKVAPALGIVIQPKYLRDAVEAALSIPSEYNTKRRLNFCIWTETHKIWIPSDRWDACRVDTARVDNAESLVCTVGLDASTVGDLTSCVVTMRIPDPVSAAAPEEVEIEGMDEAGERVRQIYTLNFTVEIAPFFWIPQATLQERVVKERIPMDLWERQGHLRTTPGEIIDHTVVYDQVREIVTRFKVQKIGMDENNGRLLFVMLRDQARLGDKVVSIGQAKKLSEAYKLIDALVRTRRLRHNGHPVMAWNVANAEPKEDRLGAIWIEKPSAVKRIDGAVALAMAIHQLMVLPFTTAAPQLFFMGGKK